jgi:hypothetical protein
MDYLFDMDINDNQINMDMFNDDYFEATEGTGLKRTVVGLIAGSPGELIYSAIHKAHINKSIVIDRNALIKNGIEPNKASSMVNQSIAFFKKNELIKPEFTNNEIVKYTDLTPKGQQFIRGYYMAMDEITPYDIEKSVHANKQLNTKFENAGNFKKNMMQTFKTKSILGSSVGYVNTCAGIGKAIGDFMFQHSQFSAIELSGNVIGIIIAITCACFNARDILKADRDFIAYKETLEN